MIPGWFWLAVLICCAGAFSIVQMFERARGRRRHAAARLGLPDLGRGRRHDLVHPFRGDAGVRGEGPRPARSAADDRLADDRGHRLARRLLAWRPGARADLRTAGRRGLRRRHLRHAFHGHGRLSRRRDRQLGLDLCRRLRALRCRSSPRWRWRFSAPPLPNAAASSAGIGADRPRDRLAAFRRDDRDADHPARAERDAARAGRRCARWRSRPPWSA